MNAQFTIVGEELYVTNAPPADVAELMVKTQHEIVVAVAKMYIPPPVPAVFWVNVQLSIVIEDAVLAQTPPPMFVEVFWKNVQLATVSDEKLL